MRLRFHRVFIFLAVVALAAASVAGHAASIDCGKAASATEKKICTDPGLLKLDREVAAAHDKALKSHFGWTLTGSFQAPWKKKRDACGKDATCLELEYKQRLSELQNYQFAVIKDQAGNRMDLLLDESSGVSVPSFKDGCTPDMLVCVRVSQDDRKYWPWVEVEYASTEPITHRFQFTPDSLDVADLQSVSLWPHVLRTGDSDVSLLVGLIADVKTDISGKTDTVSMVHLFKVWRNERKFQARELLAVPRMVLQRFDDCDPENTEEQQTDVCKDNHYFFGLLALDRSVKSGFPHLVFQTRAWTIGKSVSRTRNSAAASPSPTPTSDPDCTFKRTFRINKDGVYASNQPFPECSRYTEPQWP